MQKKITILSEFKMILISKRRIIFNFRIRRLNRDINIEFVLD